MLRTSSIILFSLILNATLTTVPLSLIALLTLTVTKKKDYVFLLAFVMGVILDITAVRPIGATSLFFVACVFLVLLYDRKYEIDSMPFVMITAFVGSLIFLLAIHAHFVLPQAALSVPIALVLHLCFRFIYQASRKERNRYASL